MQRTRTLPHEAVGFHIEHPPSHGIMADYNRMRPRRTRTVALSACISYMPDGTTRVMQKERAERKPQTYTRADGIKVEIRTRLTAAQLAVAEITARRDEERMIAQANYNDPGPR